MVTQDDEIIQNDKDVRNENETSTENETTKEESNESIKSSTNEIENKIDVPSNKKDFFSFIVKLSLAMILAILSFIAVRPLKNCGILYIVYYLIFIVFVIGVLICYIFAEKNFSELQKFFLEIQRDKGKYSALNSKNKKINDICDAYKKSFLISGDDNYHKTRANSDLYFGSETWMQDMNQLPIKTFLKIIPGTFIGFGILGTFIGFASGLSSINITDSQSLLNGVQQLLNGLKSAFNTSIVGVLASVFLNFIIIHPLFNSLDHCSKKLCDYLDIQFFVTEVDAMAIIDENNNLKPFPVVLTEILTRLEGVSSNINVMGLKIGDQVTTSVKETLDKTIEKIIKAEITKLKEEINSSIKLLNECQTNLQNAPQHLKEAAINMENSAKDSVELFKCQSITSIQAMTDTINNNLNSKFDSYVNRVEEVSEEMLNIKNTLVLMPDNFKNIDNSISTTTNKLTANQENLANVLYASTNAFDKTNEISESLSKAYDEQTNKIEKMVSKFTDVLNEYKETSKESKVLLEGFKGMDVQISGIFTQINENTQNYGKIVGESLENYFKSFQDATKDISKQFADATLVLSEEVHKLNSIK